MSASLKLPALAPGRNARSANATRVVTAAGGLVGRLGMGNEQRPQLADASPEAPGRQH